MVMRRATVGSGELKTMVPLTFGANSMSSNTKVLSNVSIAERKLPDPLSAVLVTIRERAWPTKGTASKAANKKRIKRDLNTEGEARAREMGKVPTSYHHSYRCASAN